MQVLYVPSEIRFRAASICWISVISVLFYNFECFLIFKFNSLVLGISRERFVQGASEVLKGASLVPLRFLHAQSFSLRPIALKGAAPSNPLGPLNPSAVPFADIGQIHWITSPARKEEFPVWFMNADAPVK
jgi:hypothetical protein